MRQGGFSLNLRRLLLLLLFSSLLLLPLFTVPASAHPALLIQRTWGGNKDDEGFGVAVDSSGNIYVTGDTDSFGPGGPSNRSSLSLLKYDTTGSLLWQRIWSGSGNGTDEGFGVAVDSSGNVYVTGDTDSFGVGNEAVLLLKFNSSGSLLWQRTWGDGGLDYGLGVAVDSSGNIYVTGSTNSFGVGGVDVFLLRFDSFGSLLWQRTWGGSSADYGNGVVVDSSGHIYVTGSTNSFGVGDYEVFLLQFDSTGSLLWQRIWGGGGYGSGVAVDSSGHIYVTGESRGVLLLKFDSTGNLLWKKSWSDTNTGGDSVAVDSSGSIYVTGSAGGGCADCLEEGLLLKFDSSGSLLWGRTWNGSNSHDFGFGVAVDSSGNALVTGSVAEAPPYTLVSPKVTLATPAGTTSNPGGSLGNPAFTLHTRTGTVLPLSGSQSYAGSDDQFLMKYGLPPSSPLYPSGVLLAALITTVTIALGTRRRRFN